MTIEEFFNKCQSHDWHYEMSDDHGVWRRGNAARKVLTDAASNDATFKKIYDAWLAYMYRQTQDRPKLSDYIFEGFVP